MGKASKWMVNFLLGKKEGQAKKKDIIFLEENMGNSAAIVPSSPKIRRKWSFGRSSSKEKAHRSSKSLDLITTNHPVVLKTIVDLEKQQQQNKALAVAVVRSAGVETVALTPKQEIDEASRAVICKVIEDSAATKIQAFFRSYLARKALHALKGLVKLQALVRGHLVRKQTTATLRQMHALMTIQVRARFHRIQMAGDETRFVVKSQSSRYKNISHANGHRPLKQATDFNAYKAHGVSKNKNGYLDHSQIKKLEQGVAAYFSGDVSFSKREHQYEDFSSSTTHNTPRNYYHETPKIISGRASISGQKPDYLLPLPHHDQLFFPNYMADTESSRAKVRSQSEPKQRPGSNTKVKGTRTASMDRTGVPLVTQTQSQTQCSSPQLRNGNQDLWFVKLYRSKKFGKASESDANSITSHSNYESSVMAYEPHVTMY